MQLKNRRLSIVSNAESYELTEQGRERVRGGLTAAFDPLMQDMGGLWTAWGRGENDFKDRKMESYKVKVPDRNGYTLKRIPLTEEEQDKFYYGFSNDCLWLVFHGFLGIANFDSDLWATYRKINERYAEAVAEEHQEKDLHWIQDYHLMLVPQKLREKRPRADIGYFLHIPWPAWNDFRHLNWRADLIRGLLGADIIGFHVPSYVDEFFDCLRRLVEREELKVEDFDREQGKIRFKGRTVKVESVPLGIDHELYRGNSSTRQKAQQLKENYGTEHLVWGLDRIDVTKGIPERFRGFDRFLEEHSDKYGGKISFVQKASLSRRKLEVYQDIEAQIAKKVGDIFGKYAELSEWVPVWYSHQNLSLETLIAHNHIADLALVTPLVDGMNLVAKEWIAGAQRGLLILSEFAGFAEQLREQEAASYLWEQDQHGAILVNPRCEEQVAEAIRLVLEMPDSKRMNRLAEIKQVVEQYDLEWWRDTFLELW